MIFDIVAALALFFIGGPILLVYLIKHPIWTIIVLLLGLILWNLG